MGSSSPPRAEDALDQVQRLEVVVGDGGVAAAHHEQDGKQAGDRDRGQRRAGRPEASRALVPAVEVEGHPVRVDGRDRPVEERHDVARQDRHEDHRLEDDADQLQAVGADDAQRQGEEEERHGGEAESPIPGAGVRVAQPGEDQRQEGGREGGAGARARLLRAGHRG